MAQKNRRIPVLFKLLSNRTFFIAAVAIALVAVILIVMALAGVFGKPRSYSGPERALVDGDGAGIDLMESPSEDAAVIEHLKTGTVLFIEGKKGEWLNVTVRRTGETGWCKKSEVKREGK